MSLNADIIDYILENVSNTSHHMAQLLKKMYGQVFRPVLDPKNSQKFIWQVYIDNVWQDMPQAIELHKRITMEVIPYITAAKAIIRKRHNEATNEVEAEYELMKYKQMYALESKLDSRPFRNHIVKDCEYLFYKK